jgi:hypothetical protein
MDKGTKESGNLKRSWLHPMHNSCSGRYSDFLMYDTPFREDSWCWAVRFFEYRWIHMGYEVGVALSEGRNESGKCLKVSCCLRSTTALRMVGSNVFCISPQPINNQRCVTGAAKTTTGS